MAVRRAEARLEVHGQTLEGRRSALRVAEENLNLLQAELANYAPLSDVAAALDAAQEPQQLGTRTSPGVSSGTTPAVATDAPVQDARLTRVSPMDVAAKLPANFQPPLGAPQSQQSHRPATTSPIEDEAKLP